MHVLNTRPEKQSAQLTALIHAIGASVFQLPLMYISAIVFHPILASDFDLCIFTSSNAVRYFFLKQRSELFLSSVIIAVGPATQQTLRDRGLIQTICPTIFSSEGILTLPILSDIRAKKIAVITGHNPKSLLIDTLSARGAQVTSIHTYRRIPRHCDMTATFLMLQQTSIDYIISTSSENLSHLLQLFHTDDHRAWLLTKTLCVVTEDMKNTAKQHGFRSIIVAQNATDEAIVCALQAVHTHVKGRK